MVLIGIVGKKMVGKDVVAFQLCKEFGFESMAFAKPIKEVAELLFGFDIRQLETSEGKETVDKWWGITPRKALQHIGQAMRELDLPELKDEESESESRSGRSSSSIVMNGKGSFWLRYFFDKYDSALTVNNVLDMVVSDVRFKNEAFALKSRGAILIRIVRDTKSKDNDVSEQEQNDINCDYVIQNNGTFAELAENVRALMSKIKS